MFQTSKKVEENKMTIVTKGNAVFVRKTQISKITNL